jgi:hypothetical protein
MGTQNKSNMLLNSVHVEIGKKKIRKRGPQGMKWKSKALRLLTQLVKTLHQSIAPITRKQPRGNIYIYDYFGSVPYYIFYELTSLPRFQSKFS